MSNKKRVAMGSDHAGFELKDAIAKELIKKGYEVVDVGNASASERASYAEYGHKLANLIQAKKGTDEAFDFGIGVCGTGLGISYALNRHEGIVAARMGDSLDARLAKEHNNANVICFGGRIHTLTQAMNMLDEYENATFEGGRHEQRIKDIDNFVNVKSEK